MDAMPLTFAQEFGAWAAQLQSAQERIEDALKRLRRLPIGGTAIGTGINADPRFGQAMAQRAVDAGRHARSNRRRNKFEGMAAQDDAVELSGQLNALAVALMKIANDLRWMNSGPLAGLGEIELPALQPGSSIMPGKVNPVIPEAVAMVCAQVMGHHTAITVAGQSGNFQLNVMLPLIAYDLLDSIRLLAQCRCGCWPIARSPGLKVREAACARGAGPQSDPGDRAESGHRLRKGRGDRQAGLQGRSAGAGGGDGNQRLAGKGPAGLLDPAALTRGGIHARRGGRRLNVARPARGFSGLTTSVGPIERRARVS